MTGRPFVRGAARQLLLGAAAAAITYGIGYAVGAGTVS
jgi:VIT1/CCC1 family predicted Fe2+/Mn2+ transporter